jgi:hypothetical protein
MNTTTNTLVQKLWNYCNVLRDDGMSCLTTTAMRWRSWAKRKARWA